MFYTILLIVGALIAAAGALPYILATMKGTVRPQLVSWSVWSVLAAIMTISAYLEGQTASMLLSLSSFAGCSMIVILGWRQGKIQFTKLDVVCLVGAVAGIGSLIVLRNPLVALSVSVAVDLVAFAPTMLHGLKSPREESLACFGCSVFAASISLFVALQVNAGVVGLIYPVYAVIFNGLMVSVLLYGRTTPGARLRYQSDEV